MVNWQINQEIVSHTNSWKKNKRKSKFIRERRGGFFCFFSLFFL